MLPRITFSIPISFPFVEHRLARAANHARADGIDLDVGGSCQWPGIGQRNWMNVGSSRAELSTWSVRSSDLHDQKTMLELGKIREAGTSFVLVVKLPPHHDFRNDHAAAIAAASSFASGPRPIGVVLSIPATVVDDGRAHLARVRGLKRLAEEWDLSLGFEFDRRTDPRWEAEAAVHISGSRLAFVRLVAPLDNSDSVLNDVAKRTLRSCADIDFGGTISLAPSLPLWRTWHPEWLASDFERKRDIVRRAFAGSAAPINVTTGRSVRFR